MANFKASPHEFIQQAFAPMIAILHTPGVDEICKKNNLNVIQFLKPFSKASVDCAVRDPSSNAPIPIKSVKVSFCDINARPPPPPVARSYFNNSVSSNILDKTVKLQVGESSIEVPASTPWFDSWRDTFLQVQYPSDHEFTKHFVGCLIVISSLDQGPLERLAELVDQLQTHMTSGPNKLPKWFGPPSQLLTTYLFLHDNSTEAPDLPVLEAMKATYGANKCFMLSINSQTETVDISETLDPWSPIISTCISYKDEKDSETTQVVEAAQEAGESNSPSSPVIAHPLSPIGDGSMTALNQINASNIENDSPPQFGRLINKEDLEKIQQFINEFCAKALIPHFEQQIHLLSDQISNKKGVSRSLFSATKRWFGTSKPGSPGNHISPTAIAYSSDSHELQLRRLGDLCFMIGHYALAFSAYHSAKRDFGADGAWLHYAGALEMAALSAFMINSESFTRKVIEYSEESIVTYLNSCRMNQFATRATLLSVECLKGLGLYGEAAKQLIRMSGEDSDLRSAVLLEQAAYCFLSSSKPVMHRKYAFHMVLAGHRFSKASHKNHSVRCYYQAYQVYGNKSWSVAEDHILYTIGKHASSLKLASNAVEALTLLVTRSSRQSPQQQELYLKDYISTIQQLSHNSDEKVTLSLPLIDSCLTQVLLSVPNQRKSSEILPASGVHCNNNSSTENVTEETTWWKLEEKLVNTIQSGNYLLFKPTIELLSHLTDNSSSSTGFVGESIGVNVYLKNPLNIQINIKDILLSWIMYPEGLVENKDTSQKYITAEPLKEVSLQPDSTKYIMLTLTPQHVGDLHITGLSYSLCDPASENCVHGSQALLVHKNNKIDKRLHINIVNKVPHLDVSFSGLRKELISGEILSVKIFMKNIGDVSISKILMTTSNNFSVILKDCSFPNENSVFNIPLKKPLDVGESIEKVLLMQPLFKGATKNFDLLFYYESGILNSKRRYRLVRHSCPIIVYDSFNVKAVCSESHTFAYCDEAINVRLQISANTFESAVIRDLQIESLSIVSTDWKLSKTIHTVNNMVVPKGESLFMLVQALKSSNSDSKSVHTSSVKFTNNSEGTFCDYFIPRHTVKLGDFLDIICIFRWSTDMISSEEGYRKAFGQEYVHLRDIEDKTPAPPSSSNTLKIFTESTFVNTYYEQNLVNFMFQYPQKVSHDFLKDKLCVVPIILWLNNTSNNLVNLKVEASSLPQVTNEENTISENFAWMGQTVFIRQIEAKSKITVTLLAAITATGTFDLSSRLKVLVKLSNNFVQQSCKPNAIIIVDSKTSPKLII